MLRPIPQKILTDTLILKRTTGFNVYQEAQYEIIRVKNVHVQSSNDIKISATNTEVALKAIAYIDARISTPQLNYSEIEYEAQRIGGTCKAEVEHTYGAEPGEYTVVTVEPIPDDNGLIHHYEIGLI